MDKKQIAVTLGIMCILLTAGIMVQLNTIEDANNTVGTSRNADGLRDEVLKWKEKYDRTYEYLEEAEKELERWRETSTGDDNSSKEKQERLKELNAYLGLSDVSGSGVIITVQDNTSSKLVTSTDLVHDNDLRDIINEVKNIGADAISVNGQRIVQTTVINCAGAIVQINGETVGSPFVIEVVGSKDLYYNLLRPGSFINKLLEDGISVEIKRSDNITIEKYNGVLTNKYIQNVE